MMLVSVKLFTGVTKSHLFVNHLSSFLSQTASVLQYDKMLTSLNWSAFLWLVKISVDNRNSIIQGHFYVRAIGETQMVDNMSNFCYETLQKRIVSIACFSYFCRLMTPNDFKWIQMTSIDFLDTYRLI